MTIDKRLESYLPWQDGAPNILYYASKSGKNRSIAVLLCAVLLLSLSGCAGVESVPPPDGYSGYYPECNAYCADAYKNSVSAMPTISEFLGDTFVGIFTGGVPGVMLYNQDKERAAFRSLQRDVAAARKCYDDKWREVIAQYDSGQMSKGEVEKRLKEIQAGLEQVKTLIAGYKQALAKQSGQTDAAAQADLSFKGVQDEHRKAVELYVRATKTTDIAEKKKLLVESRRILKDILDKYHPNAAIASGVASNIEQVEKELRSLDSSLPQYTDQQESKGPGLAIAQQEPLTVSESQEEPAVTASSPPLPQQAKVNVKKQKNQIKQAKQAKQQPPPIAQSQKNGDIRKEQESPGERQEADAKPIEKVEKRLDSFDALYHADDGRAMQRKREALARGLASF
jgi:hypothetical protein